MTQLNLLEPDKHTAVEEDHQARLARYLVTEDDGSTAETTLMLYWGGVRVQSCTLEEWPGVQAELAAQAQARADAQALRQRVRTLAQGAVGIQVDNLTAPQVRALLVLLLHKEGALTKEGAIRPLAEWVK